MVESDQVGDDQADQLSFDISHIMNEMITPVRSKSRSSVSAAR